MSYRPCNNEIHLQLWHQHMCSPIRLCNSHRLYVNIFNKYLVSFRDLLEKCQQCFFLIFFLQLHRLVLQNYKMCSKKHLPTSSKLMPMVSRLCWKLDVQFINNCCCFFFKNAGSRVIYSLLSTVVTLEKSLQSLGTSRDTAELRQSL